MNIMKLLSIILSMIMATSVIAVELVDSAQKVVKHHQEKNDLISEDTFDVCCGVATIGTLIWLFCAYRHWPQLNYSTQTYAFSPASLPRGVRADRFLSIDQESMAADAGREHESYQRRLGDYKRGFVMPVALLVAFLPGTLRGLHKLYRNLPQKFLKQSA